LDVSFQLMFFLVCTFHVSGAEGQFSLSLPAGCGGGRQTALSDGRATVHLPQDLSVIVRSNADRKSQLIFRDGGRVMEVENSRALTELLAKHRAEPDGNPWALQVQADGSTKYSRLVEVLDACKRAGFESISFAILNED